MRLLTRILFVATVIAVCCMSGTELWAKGGGKGKGGRGGGGFKKSGSSYKQRGGQQGQNIQVQRGGKQTRSFDGQRGGKQVRDFQGQNTRTQQSRGNGNRQFDTSNTRRGPSTMTRPTGVTQTSPNQNLGSEPWRKHLDRENRKLDHRRQVADHLRGVSERNGNERLQQVADEMDQRAQSHYDKQLDKIQQKYGVDDTALGRDALGDELVDAAENPPLADAPQSIGDAVDPSVNQLAEDLNQSVNPLAEKLTGRENALYRQLRNEHRKLAKRMQAVDNMRQLAEQTGDESLLQSADQLENWAMDHFDHRMTRITDFSDRHGLTDLLPELESQFLPQLTP